MSDHESHHHGKNEIIIIKRHGGDHEGGHGGAWKIAYADFMTAMMAFFLVMWLVNAANEETKAAVASYFNPIKLTDSKPSVRGLKKPAKDADGEATQDRSKDEGEEKSAGSSADSGNDKSTTAGQEVKYSEADYFENPYAVLAEIAKDTSTEANVSAMGDGGASVSGPATGADGGEAFRDPFDPDFWTQQVEVSSAPNTQIEAQPDGVGLPDDGAPKSNTGTVGDASGTAKSGEAKSGSETSGEMKSGEGFTEKSGLDEKIKPAEVTDRTEKLSAGKATENGHNDIAGSGAKPSVSAGGGKDKAEPGNVVPDAAAASKLEAELRRRLGPAVGKLADGLTVTLTEGGLLVSISDQVKTPMFNIGSSVPKRETLLAMEKIASVLSSVPGDIIIRGHTDGRQYKKGEFDNWRLSTARAQSAYFMLLKGGLAEKRVGQVSGYADRNLKIPADPLNDQNRRIEILIKTDKG